MRIPVVYVCENKDLDQLYSNRTADQGLCFRSIASIMHLRYKTEISSFYLASGTIQVVFCWTWSEIQSVGFLM